MTVEAEEEHFEREVLGTGGRPTTLLVFFPPPGSNERCEPNGEKNDDDEEEGRNKGGPVVGSKVSSPLVLCVSAVLVVGDLFLPVVSSPLSSPSRWGSFPFSSPPAAAQIIKLFVSCTRSQSMPLKKGCAFNAAKPPVSSDPKRWVGWGCNRRESKSKAASFVPRFLLLALDSLALEEGGEAPKEDDDEEENEEE